MRFQRTDYMMKPMSHQTAAALIEQIYLKVLSFPLLVLVSLWTIMTSCSRSCINITTIMGFLGCFFFNWNLSS